MEGRIQHAGAGMDAAPEVQGGGEMKVELPNTRLVLFDCPWTGHLYDDRLVFRNSTAPNVIGHRCVKCGCLVYEVMVQSQIVGPGGDPLPKA